MYISEIFNKNQWSKILILMCIKVYEQQIDNARTWISQNYTHIYSSHRNSYFQYNILVTFKFYKKNTNPYM